MWGLALLLSPRSAAWTTDTSAASSTTTWMSCFPPSWRSPSKGPKAVGKTLTAARRAKTDHRLDDPTHLALLAADMELSALDT